MKRKNELDILLNGNDDVVDSLALRPVLTKKEREKMLEMSKKKLAVMKEDYSEASYNVTGDSVQGVERYNRPVVLRRILSAAACLVVMGGIAGTVFLLKNNDGNKGIKGNSDTVDPAMVTTTAGNDNVTETTIVSTGTYVTTVTSSEPAVSSETGGDTLPQGYGSGAVEAAALSYMADFTARYDTAHLNIQYCLADLNKDNVPELLINAQNRLGYEYYLCAYDGQQYNDITPDQFGMYGFSLEISPDSGMLHSSGKNCPDTFMRLNSDNTMETLDSLKNWWDAETDSIGYWNYDESISESEYNSILAKYEGYNWITPDYIFYADHNAYFIDNAPELHTDINFEKLVEYGVIPDTDRTFCVGYDTLEIALMQSGEIAGALEQLDGYSGGVAGEDYSYPTGTITDVFPHYGNGRLFRLRVEVIDRETEERDPLLVAEVDFAAGECNIIENYYPDAVDMHF